MIDYANDNLSIDLGLPEMVGVANLNHCHSSCQFKRSTVLSPHQYVIQRRVELAGELLSKTNLSVGDIASAAGATSVSLLPLCVGSPLCRANPATSLQCRYRRPVKILNVA